MRSAAAVMTVSSAVKTPFSYTSAMNGRASTATPAAIGAMRKTSVLSEVRVSRSLSAASPEAAARAKCGKSRFVATKENSPTRMI